MTDPGGIIQCGRTTDEGDEDERDDQQLQAREEYRSTHVKHAADDQLLDESDRPDKIQENTDEQPGAHPGQALRRQAVRCR